MNALIIAFWTMILADILTGFRGHPTFRRMVKNDTGELVEIRLTGRTRAHVGVLQPRSTATFVAGALRFAGTDVDVKYPATGESRLIPRNRMRTASNGKQNFRYRVIEPRPAAPNP